MKLLVDMNLSPMWVEALDTAGHQAVHWSKVGNPRAPDTELMAWARAHGYVVFTHDLDFGALLAVTNAQGPSVIQIRSIDVTPQGASHTVLPALQRFSEELQRGVLISIDDIRARAHVLPLRGST